MAFTAFNEIVRRADAKRLHQARQFVADHLHVHPEDLEHVTAVAYIDRHFEQGVYSGWEGWLEMVEADDASERRARERRGYGR
jgi:hypothetical protein